MTHHTGSVPDYERAPDWRDSAACRTHDPELWHPKGYEGPWQLVVNEAKSICARCPVLMTCRTYALEKHIEHGIWGGLTEHERRNLRRQAARRGLTVDAITNQAPTTLRAIFNKYAAPLPDGHVGWTGPPTFSFRSRTYTGRRVAWILDRDQEPHGHVLAHCGLAACIHPDHIADHTERWQQHGTRAGYQRHLNAGETPCQPCTAANTAADNELRRTGSSKTAG